MNFKKDDILVIRISKGNKQIQQISKIYNWGKIHIPQESIKFLDIKNHETINFEIVSRNKELNLKNSKRVIDLAELTKNGLKTIPRENNYLTIYCKRKRPITLPRFIEISPTLIELFYMIHGDGHYKYKLYFVNKMPELHKFVLDKFEEILKVPKEIWKYRILISDLSFQEYAKKYWKNKLKLKENKFYCTSKSRLNTNEKGNLRIILDNTIIATIFRFIFDRLKLLEKENYLHALNGLLYAEGGAQQNKASLHKITLSFNREEKMMFQNILDNLNLKYTVEQNRNFVIQGWNNQCIFFKTFASRNIIPFRIHNQRRQKALKGFLNHSFTKTMIKYLSTLKVNDNINIRKFSELLGIRKDSVLDTIRKNQYKSLVKLKKNKFITISIKKEGLLFINLVKKIKDMEENYGRKIPIRTS